MVIKTQEGRPMLATNGGNMTRFAEVLEWGHHLANTPSGLKEGSSHRELWQSKGWKEFVEGMPEHKRAYAAIMLENCRSKFGNMEESTRTSSLGTFDKWIFPVIANMAENDVIDQLVALQPMAGPVSQIVYVDIVTDKAKGRVPAGSPMWRALQGASDRYMDSDEKVEQESLGTQAAGTTSATLAWTPIRSGSVRVGVGSDASSDDGNGNIISAGGITGGTVNYVTGAITVTGAGSNNGQEVTVDYVYDSEGNINIMGYEMKLSSTPVTAKVLKLKAVWSEEADQNLQAMYNIKAEPILLNALTNALQYQKHRQVIADLRSRADAGVVTWDAQAPTNVSYQTHKFSVIDAIATGSNLIFGATNMAAGNWILAGLQLATVIETLPQFVAKGNRTQMQGITYIGDLAGKKVFADPHYPNNEFLIGHKGDQFLVTGYVLAEYQKLYTTPDIVLPDFNHQRGFATSFAKKVVNSKMYVRGKVLNAGTNFGPTIT
jgi:hypothetical protein